MKNLRTNKILYAYIIGISALPLALLLGTMLGSTGVIGLGDILRFIFSGSETAEYKIFLYVRLPRVIASILCGGALAVSGAVIQGVLANKLASPGIIGVNSGAGLAVTIAASLGLIGGYATSAFAFLGAFFAVITVSFASKKWSASGGTLILIGVALNSLLGAISDIIITFIPEISIMTNDFKIGDFSSVTPARLIAPLVLILGSLAVLLTISNELEILTLGENNAISLGLNTSFYRTLFLILAALLAGSAVSIAGLLSFVGLIVPHAVRLFCGTRSKHLIALCALYGASFVSICDTASRLIFAPYEVPVGIIMSIIGAPSFIIILLRAKGGRMRA